MKLITKTMYHHHNCDSVSVIEVIEILLHFLAHTTNEYNLLTGEEGDPAQSCWPHTHSCTFFR